MITVQQTTSLECAEAAAGAQGAGAEPAVGDEDLLRWAAERAGFACAISVGKNENERRRPGSDSAKYAAHLTGAISGAMLVRALGGLKGRCDAVVIVGRRLPAYRECVEIDGQSRVVVIRRGFCKEEQRRHRPMLLGVVWRIGGPMEGPGETNLNCWRTARRVMREARRVKRMVCRADDVGDDIGAGAAYFIGPQTRHRPVYAFLKRGFDICFSLAALLATLPICLVVAAIIKAHDRGPIFFSHRRESLNGRPFGCLKFRTMVLNADKLQQQMRQANQVDGPQFKISYDPRITPIGHFLRRTNIDELPQFINVLLGNMSVVGPRPSPFEENQLCPGWREARLSVKPGITGLWQVSRSRERGAADFQEWILYDTQYVERRGFWLDIKIVLLTVKELFGKGE